MVVIKDPNSSRTYKVVSYSEDFIIDNSQTKEVSDIQFNNAAQVKTDWNWNRYSRPF